MSRALLVHICAFTLALGFGCGASRYTQPEAQGASAQGSGSLSVAHVQLMGSHNSYHRAPHLSLSRQWRYTHPSLGEQLARDGVRQLELDVRYVAGELRVSHLPWVDGRSSCKTLRRCLLTIRKWSKETPRHLPVFVFIEPKEDLVPSGLAGRIDVLDSEIAQVFPRQDVLSPDDVASPAESLRDVIATRGWPSLEETRGRVAFVLFGPELHRRAYTRQHTDGRARWMFVAAHPDARDAAVWMADDPVSQGPRIRAAVERGLLVRTRADAGLSRYRSRRNAALESGAHFISTDFVKSSTGWLVFDGERPARCNPVTAGAGCEDAFLAERGWPSWLSGSAAPSTMLAGFR